MKVSNLIEQAGLKVVTGSELDVEFSGVYSGDLLSWVMSKAEEGQAWLTVMGNTNVIAVAKLTDVACVIICEDAPIDAQAIQQADANGIILLATNKTTFELSCEIYELMKE